MSAPAILIRLELEASPRLLTDCVSEGEQQRLLDWLRSRPALLELVETAIELEQAA